MTEPSFSETLQAYLDEARCNARELAEAAGVSASSVSRYLSGERVPDAGNAVVKLAAGISALTGRDAGDVEYGLARASAGGDRFSALGANLGRVMSSYGIAANRLARHLGFDPSYISRIVAGQRKPAAPQAFAEGVASYVARNHFDDHGRAIAADLVGVDVAEIESPEALARAICDLLGSDRELDGRPNAVGLFLERLDEFDLNDFLRRIRFDEMKVPTAPFQLPTTKTYTGIEQMKQAEIDFLKAAALSRSTEDVILYSDMPLAEMASDAEYPKAIMAGMAALVRKGIRLVNIHDVHRPFGELAMGLEGWIPVYMTGQVSPYYLPQPTNHAFLHFIRSAGTVAVTGEAIAGNQGDGRYEVTKSPADVAYVRKRAYALLAHARPLLRVFREGDGLESALEQLGSSARDDIVEVGRETFKNMRITVWPGSHALIEKTGQPEMAFLVEYPALVDAIERYEPTLF